jgi:hypothetical protein
MNKYLKIVGGVTAFIFIVIAVVAFTLPDQITREKVAVSYQQTGAFNYQVYLKPSALYDGAADAAYPAQIVNRFDFTFRFQPSSNVSSNVIISAVLSNPGIWQKRLFLASNSAATGSLTAPFSIQLDSIQAMFNSIEDELLIAGLSRNLTIEAAVTSGGNAFTHRLELEFTETVARVDNNLSQGQLAGESSYDYAVALKPNSVFDTSTLSPPADIGTVTAPAGEPVLIRLADQMVADYHYRVTADQPVSGLTTQVEILATLSAPDLWTKTFPLYSGQQNGIVDERMAFNLAAMNTLIEAVRTETGVSADTYRLDITATTRLRGSSAFGPIDESFTATMKGTISRNVLTWDKELTTTVDGEIKTEETVPNDQKYIGLSVGDLRTWSLALAIFGAALLFSGFMIKSTAVRPVVDPQEKELALINKKYGARIVSASGSPGDGAEAIGLHSIEGLVSVADELGKPIVYFTSVSSPLDHVFCVIDGKNCYQYRVKPTEELSEQ